MKVSSSLILAAAALAASGAQAQEIYGGINLFGANVGYAHSLNDSFGVRADFTGGKKYGKDSGSTDEVRYDGKLKGQYLGVYGDWFPTASPFRVSAGLTMHQTKITASAIPGSNARATVGGVSYDLSDAGLYINATAKFTRVAPYLGVGWGHHKTDKSGLGFYADFGLMYGKFKLNRSDVQENITTSPLVKLAGGAAQTVTEAQLQAEINKVQDDLNKLKFLPLINVGLIYRF